MTIDFSPATIEQRIRRASAAILLRREVVGLGELSDGELATRVLSKRLTRLARGAYIDHLEWLKLFPDQRLLAVTLAHAKLRRGRGWIFARESAAALWGLPLFGLDSLRVHLSVNPDSAGRSTRPVVRHVETLADDELVEIAGVRFTSLERTVLDLAHSAKAELAIGALDAAVRSLFQMDRGREVAEFEQWQADTLGSFKGSWRPGVRTARVLLGLADGRAGSVLESVSRLHLARLGVPHEVQVPVFAGERLRYWMDFELLGQQAFGEVDGAVKYLDPALRNGLSAAEVVLAEKQREDEVRGITGKRVVRWDAGHLRSARDLGRRLAGFGIHVRLG
ncbi:hypothetical protein [Leucobacter sp. BZR 635]